MSHSTRSTEPTASARVQAARIAARNLLDTLLVVATLSATACQPQPSSAPTTAGPTPTPTRERSEIAFDDAEAAYRNYMEVYDQVAQDYYRGWQEKLLPLEGESTQEDVATYFAEGEINGYHQVGDTVIDGVEAWQYEEGDHSTGRETVKLRVCIDSTGVQDLSPEGVDMLGEDTAGRYFHVVTMKHEPRLADDGRVLPDADDPRSQAWWRGAGSITQYEAC